ncbi:MAG: hypothetical protein HGB29_04720 [Chlorobiaceae bacterium]|nr:hypothetical protein [Chlorobiaceae bacterium]
MTVISRPCKSRRYNHDARLHVRRIGTIMKNSGLFASCVTNQRSPRRFFRVP